jgi:superfamily II DNA or RNA helicase
MQLKSANLQRYLESATLPIQKRGMAIFDRSDVSLTDINLASQSAVFKVASEQSSQRYSVKLNNFGKNSFSGSCNCPYDYAGPCKHIVASILKLDVVLDEINQNEASEVSQIPQEPVKMYPTSQLELPFLSIDDATLRQYSLLEDWKVHVKRWEGKVKMSERSALKVKYLIFGNPKTYAVTFEPQKESETIRSTCSCNQSLSTQLCIHKLVALLDYQKMYGKQGMLWLTKDWESQKNILLEPYGFTTKDDLKDMFDFVVNDDGEMKLEILDSTLQKTSDGSLENALMYVKRITQLPEISYADLHENSNSDKDSEMSELGFALMKGDEILPELVILPCLIQYYKTKKIRQVIDLRMVQEVVQKMLLSTVDKELYRLVRGFGRDQIMQFLRKQSLVGSHWVSNKQLSEQAITQGLQFAGRQYERILSKLGQSTLLYFQSQYLQASQAQEISFSEERLKPSFILKNEGDFMVIDVVLKGLTIELPFIEFDKVGFWFYKHQDTLFKMASMADAAILDTLPPGGFFRVKQAYAHNMIEKFVLPLAQQFEVDYGVFLDQVQELPLRFLETRIYLKEDEENLLLVPAFAYYSPDSEDREEALEFSFDGRDSRMSYVDGHFEKLIRQDGIEERAWEAIQSFHPDFALQNLRHFFTLSADKVLANDWFFQFYEMCENLGFQVLGFKNLKHFNYNPNPAKFSIRTSSGIDWFDMQMELQFGDQFVGMADIRKAILNKQNYVLLKDGTRGILPEKWFEKYQSLFKFGQIKGNDVKISKAHFSLIDELYDQIDSEEVKAEIDLRKRKLREFKEIKEVSLPTNVYAQLRDYQYQGFNWLNFLDEFKFGGCLADDMGLGKTVQMLTFLQDQVNKFPTHTNLVVVPTSLIFNWQAEIEKFCPSLRVFVYKGMGRNKKIQNYFSNYHIILTTYGMVKKDIEQFRNFKFHYVVLDESQAIKNPDSQAAKSVKLLHSHNRLVMTGTPIENNTFDLYSQIDFLNPGLLGGQEFFRSEYATPIDKFQDIAKAQELRKVVYPFMLKRTKEEVAKDLPDKTETILYCEMDKKQRKVYDTVREMYRGKIAQEMELVGKEKTGFLILEGLLKLRQICDHPRLLKDDVDYPNESAKLDELVREIEENASDHKILIFSQFLKMLDLIKQYLEQKHIPYEYLDGQTTDRAARVNRFQNDRGCRVFLMSLKAGGVGLNLTEADYVYLVDPWWNPAVEAQAIDRTHRIGQKKKVFAYRMICKDSIEEKILELQAKKKELADDLISTEAGFIKKLTKDDIINLFS